MELQKHTERVIVIAVSHESVVPQECAIVAPHLLAVNSEVCSVDLEDFWKRTRWHLTESSAVSSRVRINSTTGHFVYQIIAPVSGFNAVKALITVLFGSRMLAEPISISAIARGGELHVEITG